MIRQRNLFSAITALGLSFGASAVAAGDDTVGVIDADTAFGLTNFVTIRVNDQIRDKCWTNIEAIKSRSKLEFERNEINVFDYDPAGINDFAYYVFISALGFRTNGICVGGIEVSTHQNMVSRYGGKAGFNEYLVSRSVTTYSTSFMASNPSNLNNQFSDFVSGAIAEIITKIIVGRRDPIVQKMREEFKHFHDKPISVEEAQRIMKERKSN